MIKNLRKIRRPSRRVGVYSRPHPSFLDMSAPSKPDDSLTLPDATTAEYMFPPGYDLIDSFGGIRKKKTIPVGEGFRNPPKCRLSSHKLVKTSWPASICRLPTPLCMLQTLPKGLQTPPRRLLDSSKNPPKRMNCALPILYICKCCCHYVIG